MTLLVVDPICGMRIDPADAVASLEVDGTTISFCSTACRDAYLRSPGEAIQADIDPHLSAAELADLGDADIARIHQLTRLGIVQPIDGRYDRADVMRVRVAAELEAIGFEAEALAQAAASGHLRLAYLESAGRRLPRSDQTFAEIGEALGIPLESLQQVYLAFGLPRPAADERVRVEDLDALQELGVLLEAGVDVPDVLRMARVWGDAARRVAQYLPHYFHGSVEERFRRQGLGDNAAYEAALQAVGVRIGRSGEDLLGWLFRRHGESFLAEHQFQHVETALDEAGVRRRAPRGIEAALFADLSGFTRLTEEAGDEAAAGMSLQLAQLASEVADRHRGSTVKLLGDGALLHFRNPADAVRAGLDLVELVPGRDLPAIHVGVDAGPMLYDQGDYFGRTVNQASRIGALAGAGEVLVGEALASASAEGSFELVDPGLVRVKGIDREIRVFAARRPQSSQALGFTGPTRPARRRSRPSRPGSPGGRGQRRRPR